MKIGIATKIQNVDLDDALYREEKQLNISEINSIVMIVGEENTFYGKAMTLTEYKAEIDKELKKGSERVYWATDRNHVIGYDIEHGITALVYSENDTGEKNRKYGLVEIKTKKRDVVKNE
jgi:hypothetical protein